MTKLEWLKTMKKNFYCCSTPLDRDPCRRNCPFRLSVFKKIILWKDTRCDLVNNLIKDHHRETVNDYIDRMIKEEKIKLLQEILK